MLTHDQKRASTEPALTVPPPAELLAPQTGAVPAGVVGNGSAAERGAALSHWAEGPSDEVPSRQWPEGDGDVKPRGALPRVQDKLKDPTQNPDPKNEYAPNASYGEVKGVVGVKGAGEANEIDPSDVEQGSLGNCYMVAQLAAQAHANPERIRQLIKDNGDGTFTVTLHLKQGGKRVPKDIVVDSQFPQKDGSVAYAKPGDRGEQGPELWVMLIEKAFAKYSGSYELIRGSKTRDGDVFGMLSGADSGSISMSSTSKDQLLTRLGKAVANHQAVSFGAKSKTSADEALQAEMKSEGVVANHAYSLMAVDQKAGTVSLRNPWGVKHLDNFPVEKLLKYFNDCDIAAK